jgi:hypothetical protein
LTAVGAVESEVGDVVLFVEVLGVAAWHLERSVVIDFDAFSHAGVLSSENLFTLVVDAGVVEDDDLVGLGLLELLLLVLFVDAVASYERDDEDEAEDDGEDDSEDSFVFGETVGGLGDLDGFAAILLFLEFLFSDDFTSLGVL